jgi:hypothetical protein
MCMGSPSPSPSHSPDSRLPTALPSTQYPAAPAAKKTVRCIQCGCYKATRQLRGPKHENWPVCDPRPRAAPPGEYGLRSGGNGHLARAIGAINGPYFSPAWPSVVCRRVEEGDVGRWLVGVVGLGAELHQRPRAARGALLQFDWLRSTRGAQAFGSCSRRPGRGG